MEPEVSRKLAQKLRQMHHENLGARRLLDALAERKQDRQDTSAETAADYARIDVTTAAQLLKELAKAGAGDFKVGRHGYKTRIEWHYSLRSLGKIAQGERAEPAPVDKTAMTEKDADWRSDDVNMLEHVFQVRPDVKVSFKLPDDLTSREAERLANFIKHVPFND